jgi:hypothetical protein
MRAESFDNFMKGERYLKSPERVHQFIAGLPITDTPASYGVFKPLSGVDPYLKRPDIVIFFSIPINFQHWWCWQTTIARII